MTWAVKYSSSFWKSVEKVLRGLSRKEREKLILKLDELATVLQETPYPVHRFDLRKVVGRDRIEIRVRLGKYRVVYWVLKEERTILLVGFFRRDETTYREK